jgi:hypothetical protein
MESQPSWMSVLPQDCLLLIADHLDESKMQWYVLFCNIYYFLRSWWQLQSLNFSPGLNTAFKFA